MNTKVLIPFKFISLLWLAVFATPKLSGHEGSHSYSLPIENIGKVEPDKAINLYARLSGYHPEAKEHFRDALLLRGDIEDFFRRRLEELPQTPFNGRDRNIYFRIMSDLRTPWAARICGQHLLSDSKIVLPEFKSEKDAQDFFIEKGATTLTNSTYAMYALEQMNIYRAPTKFGMPTPSGKKPKRDLWREWWRSNEASIEGLLAGEDTPNPTVKDDVMKATRDQTDLQNPDSESSQLQTTGHQRIKRVETNGYLFQWRIILGILFFSLAVAGWLIHLKRRAASNRGDDH